jgi:UDP-N-acetylmuramyl pentapeptide phosphotransferase/UDP-N-acetylglucosamine-1-phosphate transferase
MLTTELVLLGLAGALLVAATGYLGVMLVRSRRAGDRPGTPDGTTRNLIATTAGSLLLAAILMSIATALDTEPNWKPLLIVFLTSSSASLGMATSLRMKIEAEKSAID